MTVPETAQFAVAVRALAEHVLRWVYVLDHGNSVVGVLARRNVLRVLLRDDAEIRAAIESETIGSALWSCPIEVTVAVRDGVVTLLGGVASTEELLRGVQLIEHIPGVVGVRNELRIRLAKNLMR